MYKLVYPSFGEFAAQMLEENLAKHTLVVGDTVEVMNKVATITGFDVCGDYVTTEGIVRKVGDEHLIIDTLNYSVRQDVAAGGTRNDKHVKYYAPPITNLVVGDIVKVGGETRTITEVGDFMYTLDNGIRLDQFLNVPEEHNLNATDMELNDCVTVPKIQQHLANLKELKNMTEFKESLMKAILEQYPIAKTEDVAKYAEHCYLNHHKHPTISIQTYVLMYINPRANEIDAKLFANPIKASYFGGSSTPDTGDDYAKVLTIDSMANIKEEAHVESIPLRPHQIEMLNILKSKPGILRGHANNDLSLDKLLEALSVPGCMAGNLSHTITSEEVDGELIIKITKRGGKAEVTEMKYNDFKAQVMDTITQLEEDVEGDELSLFIRNHPPVTNQKPSLFDDENAANEYFSGLSDKVVTPSGMKLTGRPLRIPGEVVGRAANPFSPIHDMEINPSLTEEIMKMAEEDVTLEIPANPALAAIFREHPPIEPLNAGSFDYTPDIANNPPTGKEVIVNERKKHITLDYTSKVMPNSEFANRRAQLAKRFNDSVADYIKLARATTNYKEFDFTLNGIRKAVAYLLSMSGKEYRMFKPDEVPSYATSARVCMLGSSTLLNIVIECTKTGYKQGTALKVIGDKVWILTKDVRRMRKSLDEGKARTLKMLALPGYDRDYFSEWTKLVGSNTQVIGRKPREGIMASSMAPQPLVNEANERFLMGDKPTKDE